MSYIRTSLGQGETLIYRAHFHWLYTAAALAALILLALAGIYQPLPERPWAGAVLVAAGMLAFLAIMVPIWTTEIAVTNRRLIMKRGFVRRSTHDLQLIAVEEVNLEQGIWGRLLNFGRVSVHGTGVDDVDIPAVGDPLALVRALQDGIAHARANQGTPAAGSVAHLPVAHST